MATESPIAPAERKSATVAKWWKKTVALVGNLEAVWKVGRWLLVVAAPAMGVTWFTAREWLVANWGPLLLSVVVLVASVVSLRSLIGEKRERRYGAKKVAKPPIGDRWVTRNEAYSAPDFSGQ